jgi:hypothetical protein
MARAKGRQHGSADGRSEQRLARSNCTLATVATKFATSERPLDCSIVTKLVRRVPVLDALPEREQQVIVPAQVMYGADIEAGLILAAYGICGLVEDLCADRQVVGELTLCRPAGVPEVTVAGPKIHPVADAYVGDPFAYT